MAEPPGPWPPADRVMLDDLDNDGRPDVVLLSDSHVTVLCGGAAKRDRMELNRGDAMFLKRLQRRKKAPFCQRPPDRIRMNSAAEQQLNERLDVQSVDESVAVYISSAEAAVRVGIPVCRRVEEGEYEWLDVSSIDCAVAVQVALEY